MTNDIFCVGLTRTELQTLGAHTLLTGVCALCEADSPDSQMSGLFCVTPFRTRGCTPCDACASIPAHFAAETVCWCRPFPSQSLKIPYL